MWGCSPAEGGGGVFVVCAAGRCIGGAAECTEFQMAIADVNFLKIRAS